MLGWTIWPRLYENGISAEYLSEMAAKGWRLRRLYFNSALFRKSTPARLRYAIDVMDPERMKYDEQIDSGHIQEYIQLCRESGWQLVDSDSIFYVFAAEDETASPLQTDPAAYKSTLYRRRIRSLGWALLGGFLFFDVIKRVLMEPYCFLAWENGPGVWLGSVLLLVSILLRAVCVLWMLLCEKRAVSRGRLPKEGRGRWPAWLNFAVEWSAVTAIAAVIVRQLNVDIRIFLPAMLLLLFLWQAALENMQNTLWRRFHWSRGQIKALTVILILALNLGLRLGPDWLQDRGLIPAQTPAPPAGWQPVVTAADFGWKAEEEEQDISWDSSCCASMYELREGDGEEELCTILYESDIPLLANGFFEKGPPYVYGGWWKGQEYVELDADRLGVEEALYWSFGDTSYQYLLRAGSRVFFLSAGQELTEEQLWLAASRLQR